MTHAADPGRVEELVLARLVLPRKKPLSTRELRDSLAPIFERRMGPEWGRGLQAAILRLRERDEIHAVRLTCTAKGMARALAFLGIESLPPGLSWQQLRDRLLVGRALGTGSRKLKPEQLLRLLAARAVGAAKPDTRDIRAALISQLAFSPANEPPPAESFVDQVRRIAASPEVPRIGSKAYVVGVWRAYQALPGQEHLGLPRFKQLLLEAHRAGRLVLSRADLVAAMDHQLVSSSEIVDGPATYHFIRTEDQAHEN